MPKNKPTFFPWVFPESGDFMVCTDGQSGGTVPLFNLFPAFDYPHEDGSTHWCVRYRMTGGDSVPIAEIFDGAAQDMLRGLVVDGHHLTQSDADGMDFELRGYLAALFAMAPKMHAFIRDKVVPLDLKLGKNGREVSEEAEQMLNELHGLTTGFLNLRPKPPTDHQMVEKVLNSILCTINGLESLDAVRPVEEMRDLYLTTFVRWLSSKPAFRDNAGLATLDHVFKESGWDDQGLRYNRSGAIIPVEFKNEQHTNWEGI